MVRCRSLFIGSRCFITVSMMGVVCRYYGTAVNDGFPAPHSREPARIVFLYRPTSHRYVVPQ